MLYLVIAKDGTDPDAPARRARVREQHLKEVRPLVEEGRVRLGGALLDEGRMVGSALIVAADSEAEARALLERDIYSRAGVWRDVSIYPFRRAVGAEV